MNEAWGQKTSGLANKPAVMENKSFNFNGTLSTGVVSFRSTEDLWLPNVIPKDMTIDP